jgi:regulator of replication initiation timing
MTQDAKLERLIELLERRNGTKLWPTILTIGFSVIGALISAIFYLVIVGGQNRMEDEIKAMRDKDIKDLKTSTGAMSTEMATFKLELNNLKTQIAGFNEYTKEPRFTEEQFQRAIAPLEQGQAKNQRDIERLQDSLEEIEDAIMKKPMVER